MSTPSRCQHGLVRFLKMLIRTKKIPDMEGMEKTGLARVLGAFDLTALGVGSTLGAGIYVVAGQVARQTAGPSVVVSFLVAAVASVLAGLCYAEFAARVPKAGSAYVYSYVTVGEFMAFIIGWNMILEYAIGTASVARAWSAYFDSLIDFKIQNFLNSTMPMDLTGLSSYPDFFSLGITLLLTVLLSVGVKESAKFNNVFTGVNLLVVLYVVICGLFKIDIENWHINPKEVHGFKSSELGEGGFFPFGFSGMMSGAATCFYAFVGFDCVATTGEEAKNPQKNIPLAIIISLIIISLAYCSLSTVLTLMCPYYLLDPNAPLPFVFDRAGWGVAKYIISIGALCGLSTSLLGAMFPLPRILYAMATDSVLFKILAAVNERFKTPLLATVITGVFSGLMAMMFNLKELVDMMSIGTLLAYTLVAVCVLVLRYRRDDQDEQAFQVNTKDDVFHFSTRDLFQSAATEPTVLTQRLSTYSIALLCILTVWFSAVIIFAADDLIDKRWWAILITIVPGLLIVLCLFIIHKQPQSLTKLSFKVPALPIVPSLSVFINVYLMLKLSTSTWIRFGTWMILGFIVYFGYGIRHSAEGARLRYLPSQGIQQAVDPDDLHIRSEIPKRSPAEQISVPYTSIS